MQIISTESELRRHSPASDSAFNLPKIISLVYGKSRLLQCPRTCSSSVHYPILQRKCLLRNYTTTKLYSNNGYVPAKII